MSTYLISEQNFLRFINRLIEQTPIIAPIAKDGAFVFERLSNANELRLDYDVSVLPPKKVFFPPEQVLLEFSQGKFTAIVRAETQILLGVHPYDLLAIEQTDFAFSDNYEDAHYMAQRKATTLIGSNIQQVAKRAFWDSINSTLEPQQHDGFLTYLPEQNTYVFDVLTAKAELLLGFGEFKIAEQSWQQLAKEQHANIHCTEKFNQELDKEAVKTIRQSFNNEELWNHLAADCFSCGSCNTVCPTCYCFNIEDKWHTDQVSGERVRYWDSCMTEDFAKISIGGGNTENFRENHGQRMRHRMMRKLVYLNEKLGMQACVGCGRCASACTADIASPVQIVNALLKANHDGVIDKGLEVENG